MKENADEKRFNELYARAYEKGYFTFTPFLNMEEQSILKGTYLPCVCFGGYESAERVAAGFGENIKNEDFPVTCVCAEPVSAKFADKLTHRDVLGAVMSLGIKRELTGDIIIDGGKAYIICLEKIADYLCDNLTNIRRTSVKTTVCPLGSFNTGEPETRNIFSASQRLDTVMSAVYNLSRNESMKLVKAEKVFVNSRLTVSASYVLKENDIVSVRGHGRFVFVRAVKETKKGRLVLEVKVY